jgi:hypothetical protein
VPDTWSIAWTNDTPEARQAAVSRFGLKASSLAEFTSWCTQALETGDLAWPGVFLDVDVALRTKARFLSQAEGLVVFGIALPRRLVGSFLDETRPEAGQGEPGVVAAIRRGEPPAPSGTALGFDVLGWDWGGFHSFICNGLEREFAKVLGVAPNQHGFFDGPVDAERCAEHCNLETTGAEPALWLPWLVLLYEGAEHLRAPPA